jgi:hypothetical protein
LLNRKGGLGDQGVGGGARGHPRALGAVACGGKTEWFDTEDGQRIIREGCQASLEFQREEEKSPGGYDPVFIWDSVEECIETTTETYREQDDSGGGGTGIDTGGACAGPNYVPGC